MTNLTYYCDTCKGAILLQAERAGHRRWHLPTAPKHACKPKGNL